MYQFDNLVKNNSLCENIFSSSRRPPDIYLLLDGRIVSSSGRGEVVRGCAGFPARFHGRFGARLSQILVIPRRVLGQPRANFELCVGLKWIETGSWFGGKFFSHFSSNNHLKRGSKTIFSFV